MDARILTQPFDQHGNNLAVGDKVFELLDSRAPLFNRVWLVTAFANQKAVMRLGPHIAASKQSGGQIHFVVGIDHHSTSVEALRSILALDVDARIVKNSSPGHTFHPKVYLFEATGQKAELLLGSSNLTDGGMFRNYEVVTSLSFDLTGEDAQLYQGLRSSLDALLNPFGAIVQSLSEDLIRVLIDRGDIVSELTMRQAQGQVTDTVRRAGRAPTIPPSPFGIQPVPSPPPLPTDSVRRIIRSLERRRGETIPQERAPSYEITEFYMHLNKLQGPTIPGEVRVPIAARRIDEDFWGWPDQYQTEYRERGRKRRRYESWKPVWRILDADAPGPAYLEEVRIYGYEDRAEFRFYSGSLRRMGANELDIIRITRCDSEDDATFQCELARQGSPTHALWERYCIQQMPNSQRRYGFL